MVLTPIQPEELRRELNKRVVHFAFKKLDGTLRTANGTTNLASVPHDKHPKGARPASQKVVTFFDLDKREWRSISATQEIFVL